jgi:hypothetical protein
VLLLCRTARLIAQGGESLYEPCQSVFPKAVVVCRRERAPEGIGGWTVGMLRIHSQASKLEGRDADTWVGRELFQQRQVGVDRWLNMTRSTSVVG